ncbi:MULTISPECIES: ferrochelatase [Sulfurovum]|uniref:Ferrochelatase n=1 Tax=Sulfurovum xiamenensis TaxID=3019066 RepID=A0ABT7QNQ8_9BACT|nr:MULTISPECIES: ferrochelatase [Sulfurovum]EIF50752.1 ferrochelatase [Sulfurovum sp. AR]MDM5262683.1 ferrochelatase [Sulfurovum xiamenensis]
MNKALFLLNMGGPNDLDEVELFLHNMFSDKNILPTNSMTRALIRKIIITKRLDDAKESYTHLGGKSPLSDLTHKLIDKLKSKLDMPIYAAMRYVPPFAGDALKQCKADGIEELILFPMYPQYSTTTTLSSYEDIVGRCKALDYHPKITMSTCQYFDDMDYIHACVAQIEKAIGDKETSEYDLLLSAHGLPMSIIKAGDPYQRQVESNVSAIKTLLALKGIVFKDVKLVYQSKVGSAAWLEPNLVDVLRNPVNRKVLIYPLAFTIDNSETLFELDIEHREIAEKIKYDDYIVAECMNDSDTFVDLIVKYVSKEPTPMYPCADCSICLCCGAGQHL